MENCVANWKFEKVVLPQKLKWIFNEGFLYYEEKMGYLRLTPLESKWKESKNDHDNETWAGNCERWGQTIANTVGLGKLSYDYLWESQDYHRLKAEDIRKFCANTYFLPAVVWINFFIGSTGILPKYCHLILNFPTPHSRMFLPSHSYCSSINTNMGLWLWCYISVSCVCTVSNKRIARNPDYIWILNKQEILY